MKNYSMKLKRALALVLTFVMAVSVLTVAPNTEVSAAPRKYVKSLKVSKSKLTLESGKKATVNATVKVKGSASKKVKVSLSKSAKKVVSVKVGKPSKKGVSKLTITAKTVKKKTTASVKVVTSGKSSKNKTYSKTIKVTVNPKKAQPATTEAPKEVSQVKVSVARTSLVVGDTTTATATVVPAGVSTTITWKSSNSAVATVDKNGHIVAMGAGSAVITATAANGVAGTVTITVKAVSVTGVKLNSSIVKDMAVGNTTTLVATVEPANATDRRISWSSTNEKVATVTSDGVVTAIAAGETDIVVETQDGGFKAICHITVASGSTADVDKIEASVQNAIEGHPNTVLVGTRAQIRVTVTKDGAPFGDDTASLELKGVSGYTNYYELEKDSIDLNKNGTGTAYIKLKSAYSDADKYNATIDEAENWGDAAYASFKLTVRAGGADLVQDVPVTFAQILIGNELSYGNATTPAITVNNEHNSEFVNPIERAAGGKDIQLTSAVSAEEEYYEEYVVDQQVSTEGKDHSVELDAAPMLILPSAEDETSKGEYTKAINFTSGEYSVYTGIDSAYTIENVPGGLQYLTLTFDQIKLSPYTRITVGCYLPGTNIPIDGAVITKDNVETTSKQQTIDVPKSVFENLDTTDKIDVKVFVESAGQVNEDTNVGFTLTSAKGPYKNTTRKDLEIVRLTDDVKWSVENITYTAPEIMDNQVAKKYLGNYYTEGYTYRISYPTYPATGNAIITVKDSNNTDKAPYLYPTEAVDNANVLLQNGTSRYAIPATVEEIETLQNGNFTSKVNGRGNYVIDSKKAGIVNVKAEVNTYKDIAYIVHSSVQWSPVPDIEEKTVADYYAIAQQKVELSVIVKDVEGNLKKNAPVVWDYDNTKVITDKAETKTDENGKAVLTLRSNSKADLERISVKTSKEYKLTSYVADQKITTDFVNIHWVEPGVYYKDKVNNGVETDTLGATSDVDAPITTYSVGEEWILGTKVVGTPISDTKIVTNISNIKINMDNINTGANVTATEKTNGIWSLVNEVKGTSTEKFSLGGYLNANAPCIITVKENGEEVDYTSVGTGDITNKDYALVIPVEWTTLGANLSILTESGTSFDIGNNYDGNKLHVYVKVTDTYGNDVKDQTVTYSVTKEVGNDTTPVIAKTTANTDENGLIDITFAAPNEACKYTVSAFINEDKPVSQTFNFKDVNKAFTLKADVSDGQNKKIVLTSDDKMDASILKAAMFELQDSNGQTISIDKIENDASSANKIIITTKETFSADLTITYKSTVVDEKTGQVFYFLNANGTLYQNVAANNVAVFNLVNNAVEEDAVEEDTVEDAVEEDAVEDDTVEDDTVVDDTVTEVNE